MILSVFAALYSVKARHKDLFLIPSSGAAEHAFLNARWGMTPQQVEAANPGQYQGTEQRGVKFLGREAAVSYTFRGDRLYAYRVFVSDEDADTLDADMRRYLVRTFGDGPSESEEESALKLIWQFKDRIVNYWLLKEEFSVRPKYTAGFGVTLNDS